MVPLAGRVACLTWMLHSKQKDVLFQPPISFFFAAAAFPFCGLAHLVSFMFLLLLFGIIHLSEDELCTLLTLAVLQELI